MSKYLRVFKECASCYSKEPIQNMAKVNKVKNGIATLKTAYLCPECHTKYFKHQIKDLSISKSQARKLRPGASVLDIKSDLEKWSKIKRVA